MAYRFNGSSDLVEFAVSPINLATFGPLTWAALMKRNGSTAVGGAFATVIPSALATRRVGFRMSGTALEMRTNVTRFGTPTALSSTSLWYIVVATGGSGNTPRFHVHDETSWAHAAGSSTLSTATLLSTDRLFAGWDIDGNWLAADMVCVGIKKADSADATVETIGRTWASWLAFGFDWLIGFDTSLQVGGVLQDQAAAGTGDQVAITGTSVVSDPPGWTWPGGGGSAFVPQVVIV